MNQIRIYPTIVTTDNCYFAKIEEANKLNLDEICFFPTGLNKQKRKQVYPLLDKSSIKKIPLVHLRNDMECWELAFFRNRFKTEAFNHHSLSEYPLIYNWSEFKKVIYIENSFNLLKEEEIKKFEGICLDFTHLEDDRLCRPKFYNLTIKIAKKYYCGCGHISVIKNKFDWTLDFKRKSYHNHKFTSFREFDYLRSYLKKYSPPIVALELENKLEEQLEVKNYIIRKFLS